MSDTTDPLVMVAELQVKPEQRDAFLAYTTANLPVCRAYPGNRRFDMLVEADRPGTIWFYEEWESAAAQRAYMAWRAAAGDVTTLLSFLAAPPRFIALHAVATPPV